LVCKRIDDYVLIVSHAHVNFLSLTNPPYKRDIDFMDIRVSEFCIALDETKSVTPAIHQCPASNNRDALP
jgi:hypothetical protein